MIEYGAAFRGNWAPKFDRSSTVFEEHREKAGTGAIYFSAVPIETRVIFIGTVKRSLGGAYKKGDKGVHARGVHYTTERSYRLRTQRSTIDAIVPQPYD